MSTETTAQHLLDLAKLGFDSAEDEAGFCDECFFQITTAVDSALADAERTALAEPELPGEMPTQVYELFNRGKPQDIAAYLRKTVNLTKSNIAAAIRALREGSKT